MKKLVCIGGGEVPIYKNGILLPYETKEIDEEIVRLFNNENPKLLFISFASSKPEEYLRAIKEIYEKLGCTVSHLDINKSYAEIEEQILNTDIIYVGGGNTRQLMEQLKSKNIDVLLIKAYNKGIVCSGLSAGSYCWFKYNYDLIEGIGIINAVNIAHYEDKNEIAKKKFYDVIKEKDLIGYALENCVALELIDDEVKIIKSNDNKNAYKITFTNDTYKEERI